MANYNLFRQSDFTTVGIARGKLLSCQDWWIPSMRILFCTQAPKPFAVIRISCILYRCVNGQIPSSPIPLSGRCCCCCYFVCHLNTRHFAAKNVLTKLSASRKRERERAEAVNMIMCVCECVCVWVWRCVRVVVGGGGGKHNTGSRVNNLSYTQTAFHEAPCKILELSLKGRRRHGAKTIAMKYLLNWCIICTI